MTEPDVRIAAVGDLHLGVESVGRFRPHLEEASACADVLVIAGDLTHVGRIDEAEVVAGELADAPVPVVAVLGNHDHHSDAGADVVRVLTDAGVHVLEGSSVIVSTRAGPLGIAGCKGFGGGFMGACATKFGEPEMKAFVAHTEEVAAGLCAALRDLGGRTVARVALTHYAPVDGTLQGERLEIYPFLGSYLLGEAIEGGGADVAVHGHAHHGFEKATTPGGIPVRNVALPVIRRAFAVYQLPGANGRAKRTDASVDLWQDEPSPAGVSA